jgi:diguanylate cyclase (GGDEF)-like protein/PAS domain S-box-containing protein
MSDRRLRILLVEDDEDDYVLTRGLLQDVYQDSIDLEWARTYQSAREALEGRRFDVCLLDYHLGERTGLDLLRAVVAPNCPTPIILLTGNSERDVDVEAMNAGAADYLIKGEFGGRLLERSIRYAIGYAAERQQTLEALRLSEERYALAVRGANDGLWDWDLTTNSIYYAPRWKAMLGHTEDEIGDSPEEWFSRVHPQDLDRVQAEINDHLSADSVHFESEYRIRHHDGTYRWVLTRGLVVRDAQGRSVRMAGSQTDITQRKAAEDRLIHNAFHDALTDLPNRSLLLERIEQSLARLKRRPHYRFAILFLDLDGFKLVNDSLGHQAGDQLLIAMSRRLEAYLRPGDTIARLGGDEFILFIDDIDETRDVLAMAERVLKELEAPFVLNDQEVITTASVGIALSGPNYECAETLIRDADIAMYQAKSRGKAGFVIFDEAMHASAVSRMKLESDLRLAISRHEFHLVYQPIVSLRTGQVSGFEALIRWNHPERGLVSPEEFIPVAEETKLILPMGLWVLREAAEQLRQWRVKLPGSRSLTMSVNLSCRQFCQTDLIYQIQRILLETELDARCLRLEITESVIMDRIEMARASLDRLKTLGIRLAIDDFGKGYSSLSYLHQLPFDVLKIDQSFVAPIGARGENGEIVRTMVSMAHLLGMDVVAEGVETTAQVNHLREVGCQYGQGYYFARPLSAEDAFQLLLRGPTWSKPTEIAGGSPNVPSFRVLVG